MRMIKRGVLCVLFGAFMLLGNGCGSPGAANAVIQVLDNSFSPMTFNARVGEPVSWVWNGSNPHDVKFSDGGSSSDVQTNGQFDRQFTVAGTYLYLCTIHAGMQGQVVVS